jgi:hypothetical protein
MEQALALLDRSAEASTVGAHLDLAICRLRETLGIAASDERNAATAPGQPIHPQGQASGAE